MRGNLSCTVLKTSGGGDKPTEFNYDLNKYCAVLAREFEWAEKLNSMARQASAERAWSAISRFYDNCKKQILGKKGFPKFKKHTIHGSVEYKTCGWKLSESRREITFSDGFKAGTFKLWGTRDLHYYQIKQIKRVRVVRRADGYYAQFCIDVDRLETHEFQNRMLGIDVGLNHFYTDSEGNKVENPRFLRKGEKAVKKAQRRVSRKEKSSANRTKARNRLGKKHLKISRQRKDFVVKTARALVQSVDLVAYEDLQVRNMVKNHNLAKSINDVAWSMFREWIEYYAKVFGVAAIAVAPHYTSVDCSKCGRQVKKTLSTRTHKCVCGCVLDRDHNSGINILVKGLSTVGHTETNNACEEIDRCAKEETPRRKSARRTRKPKE